MAHSQILLLLANHWKHAHHTHSMILSLTFKDRTTRIGTANSWWNFTIQSEIHTSCLSESSNIGLGHFRQTAHGQGGPDEQVQQLWYVEDGGGEHYRHDVECWWWRTRLVRITRMSAMQRVASKGLNTFHMDLR